MRLRVDAAAAATPTAAVAVCQKLGGDSVVVMCRCRGYL